MSPDTDDASTVTGPVTEQVMSPLTVSAVTGPAAASARMSPDVVCSQAVASTAAADVAGDGAGADGLGDVDVHVGGRGRDVHPGQLAAGGDGGAPTMEPFWR